MRMENPDDSTNAVAAAEAVIFRRLGADDEVSEAFQHIEQRFQAYDILRELWDLRG
jgi:hypothetical protein